MPNVFTVFLNKDDDDQFLGGGGGERIHSRQEGKRYLITVI